MVIDRHSDIAEDVIFLTLGEVTLYRKVIILCWWDQTVRILAIHWTGLRFSAVKTLEVVLNFHIIRRTFCCSPRMRRCSCSDFTTELIKVPWEGFQTNSCCRFQPSGSLTGYFLVVIHLHGWISRAVSHSRSLNIKRIISIVAHDHSNFSLIIELLLLKEILVVFVGKMLDCRSLRNPLGLGLCLICLLGLVRWRLGEGNFSVLSLRN